MKRRELLLWIDALESGQYRQTAGRLSQGPDPSDGHCCLGAT